MIQLNSEVSLHTRLIATLIFFYNYYNTKYCKDVAERNLFMGTEYINWHEYLEEQFGSIWQATDAHILSETSH